MDDNDSYTLFGFAMTRIFLSLAIRLAVVANIQLIALLNFV